MRPFSRLAADSVCLAERHDGCGILSGLRRGSEISNRDRRRSHPSRRFEGAYRWRGGTRRGCMTLRRRVAKTRFTQGSQLVDLVHSSSFFEISPDARIIHMFESQSEPRGACRGYPSSTAVRHSRQKRRGSRSRAISARRRPPGSPMKDTSTSSTISTSSLHSGQCVVSRVSTA